MPASSRYAMLCGNRLSPTEKRGKCWRSSTSTERPAFLNRAAATAPDGPAPIIATSVTEFCELLVFIDPGLSFRHNSLQLREHPVRACRAAITMTHHHNQTRNGRPHAVVRNLSRAVRA